MPNLSPYFYEFADIHKTNHYIETGTYLGDGIKKVLNSGSDGSTSNASDGYQFIHSIELSEKWYNYNVEQFKNHNNVKMYLGDSKKLLPQLLNDINEPITIFLDAHYSGGTTSFGEEEVPLLFELEILKNRAYDDIIIIDDCRLLGKAGQCGCGPNDPVYPTMNFDWTNITENNIKSLMKDGYALIKNYNSIFTDGPVDQFILYKQK